MNITAEILLNAIFLLLHDNSSRNQVAVSELLALYDDETKLLDASSGDLMRFYTRVLHRIIKHNIDKSDEQALRTFMLQFKSDPAFDRNREVMDIFQDAVTSRQSATSDEVKSYQDSIQTILLWHRTNALVRRNFQKLARASEMVTPEAQQAELMAILQSSEEMVALRDRTISGGGIAQSIDVINFSDRISIATGLEKHKARNIAGRIRTGLQGLNQMFGTAGGAVAGESISFNALPHMYKSGILTSFSLWTVVHNIPVPPDGLRPLVYVSSLENEAFQNMMWAFKHRYYVETGRFPENLTDEEAIDWLHSYFAKHGCTLIIERHMPHNFGFDEFMARIAYYRSQGFHIVEAIIDYANLMKKVSDDKSASKGGRDLAVRELFSKLCNFCKNLGIIFVTAHPLNRDGMRAIANQTNMVKRLDSNFLADSVDVEREVDVSIYMHLETNTAGRKFLTLQLRKHRYVDDTPEKHKYCAYEFNVLGVGILDDINGPPMFTRDIYALEYDDQQAQTGLVPEAIY